MPMVHSIVNFYDIIFNTYNQLCVSQVNWIKTSGNLENCIVYKSFPPPGFWCPLSFESLCPRGKGFQVAQW